MSEIVLLDGGMGQEVVRRAKGATDNLWSGRVLADEPEAVEAAHRDFVLAGARALIVCAYSLTPERLARDAGMAERFEELQERALDVATAVRADAPHDVAVLGCLPPLQGSYHPDQAPPRAEMDANYARIAAIQAPRVDVQLAETLSAAFEVASACAAMSRHDVPFWVALSVDDRDGTRLRSGESVEEGARVAAEAGAAALLLNCSRPEAIGEGLPLLAKSGLPFGAYANGFTNAAELELGGTVEGMSVRTDLDPDAYADHAMRWVEMGATIVGGCCEVGPAHIAKLHERLVAAGHEVVAP